MAYTDEPFAQAANHWDLETLYTDLASAKGRRLTPMEKIHLRGLLCGYSPAEIAEKLGKNAKGVETDLCATIYRYTKSLVGKCNDKIENWRDIAELLEEAGYKTYSSVKFSNSDLSFDKSVVNISNISFEKNQIVFLINLQIPTALSSELPTPKIDLGDDPV